MRCSDASFALLPNLLPFLLLLLDVAHAAFLMPSPSSAVRCTSSISTTTWPSPSSQGVSLLGLQPQTCPSTVAAASSSKTIPPDLVEALAERPWRTGLEPVKDVDMFEVPADCIEVGGGWAGGWMGCA